ncbi:Hypothetical protein GLP15_1857 [Giardia lamblia P15]|uniref:Uncharacterized protein n=1 Tax=Giardia intestinalis (strain P15) TaxID=658858 RepID=E1F2C8_GIAIA|nr:Hypothetical protein GLP15_1857 [Giardia lamblia P15]
MYTRCTDGAVPYYIFQAADVTFLINPVFREPPAGNRLVYSHIEPVVVLTDPEAAFAYLKTHTLLSACVKTAYSLRVLITLPLVHYILSFWDCYNLKRLFMTVPFEAVATDVSIPIGTALVRFTGPLEVHFTVGEMTSKCAVSCVLGTKLVPRQAYYISRISELYAFAFHLIVALNEHEKRSKDIDQFLGVALDSRLWPSFIFLIRLLDFSPAFDIQKAKHNPDNSTVKGTGDSFRMQSLISSGRIIQTNARMPVSKDRLAVYFKEPKAPADESLQALPMPISITTRWSGAAEVPVESLQWNNSAVTPIIYPTFNDLLLNRPDAIFGPSKRLMADCVLTEIDSATTCQREESTSEKFEL